MKYAITTFAVLLLFGIGAYFYIQNTSEEASVTEKEGTVDTTEEGVVEEEQTEGEATDERQSVIGTSVEGRDIVAYHYRSASTTKERDTEILFVGGIHGGYSWNTVLVAYEMMDYLEANPDVIPENITVTVVPVLNPDGLEEVVGTTGRFDESDVPSSQAERIGGRFNANEVDLNRNFDCDWQSGGTWQNRTVDGGTEAFSEPESQAIRNYVEANDPDAVVVWYSAAGGVFASSCHNGVLSETRTLTNLYADASGYRAYEQFDFYEITGDMVNWLAKEEIPAISVLLTNHEDIEWNKNRDGLEALLSHYAE